MASWEDFSRILAEAKASKKLDPVGEEDDDIDNDGKVDDTDSYLKNRRSSVGAAIASDRKKKSMVKISVPEKKLGYKVADIGPDGKEHNVKTYGDYKEALDPVGQEDDDIDNDGKKNTKSDKYLLNRRKVRSKVIEGASTKVDMNGPKVGCNDPDPRGMKTQANLVKTKLRLMGLRPLVMSNEPEGSLVEGKKKGDSYLETDMKKRRENNEKAVEDMKKTKGYSDMVKSARKAMGVDEEFVGEDKEYRREMAKASARERAEERRSEENYRTSGRIGKKKEGPKLSTTPITDRTAKSYVDQEMGKIKYMDKITKKNKNVVGLVTKEEVQYVDEGLGSAIRRVFGGKKKEESPKSESRGDQLRKKYNVGPEKSDTSAKRQILDRSRARAEKDERDYGDKPFQKQVAQKSKEAHNRYLKAGYSKYGADDSRGSGNKARKRAESLKKEDFEFIVNSLIEEGYDLSDYTWEQMYDICNEEVELEIEEGMTMKDFKQQRSRQKQKTKREMENKSPLRRAGIHDDKASPERAARHRANVDPDYDHDDEEDMYPGGKLKNPKKVRKAKAVGELGEGYIEEKSLSRAQQRFMGMVYAAKKGETPASPEVAKAASGMTKKAAKDFAKTKHEGLPEKKEETKEEVSLVDRILQDVMSEAFSGTIPGGKRRKGLSKTIQGKQVDKLADEGDYERADKIQDASTVKVKKNKSNSKPPVASEDEKGGEPEKKPMSKRTATERAARTSAAGRIGAARIQRETEREKREYKEKIRQEKKAEQQSETEDRRKSAEEKRQKLRTAEKERRAASAERSAQKEYDDKQSKKEKLRKEIGAATQVKPLNAVSSKESDAKAVGPAVQAAGQIAAIPFKLAGVALKNANSRRKEKQREEIGKKAKEKSLKDDSQNESFSDWREEFLFEVDDQVVNPDQTKIIDVSKKKNKIEINPKIDEAAPLIPMIAKLAGGVTSRAVGSKLAGTAAKGSLRSKAAEFAANKAGNFASNAVQDKLGPDDESRKGGDIKDKATSGVEGLLSFLMPRSKVYEAAAWTKKSGKNQSGGLNEKGRRSYEKENPGSDLKAPSKTVGNPRRKSFCARMSGMKSKLTSAKTARDPDSRINKSLRAWNC